MRNRYTDGNGHCNSNPDSSVYAELYIYVVHRQFHSSGYY